MQDNFNYEPIVFDDGLPVKVKVRKLTMIRVRWHSHPELLFVIKGSVRVHIDQIPHLLSAGHVIGIGSGQLHTLDPVTEDNLLVGIQIDSSAFGRGKNSHLSINNERFLKDQENGKNDFSELHRLMTLVVYEYDKRPKGYANQILGYVHGIIAWMIRYDYLSETDLDDDQGKGLSSRINSILQYMNEHYDEPLSLQDVADHEHVSYYYLSSSFKKVTGMTFRDHLTQIRLRKSMTELRNTKHSVEMIAAAYGFLSARSYSTLFAQYYGCTPKAYRDQYWKRNPRALDENPETDSADYEPVYAMMQHNTDVTPSRRIWKEEHEITLSLAGKDTEPVRRIWSFSTSCSRAADLLRSDIQAVVRQAREEIGFRYIRFHGIFSDDLMICHRDANGALHYNWVYVNQIFDFLHDIGLKPFLELSFMPSELASGEKTVFWYHANITPPRHMEEWRALVYQLIRHCVKRYGAEEVSQWYLEVWSQPDYQNYFWAGTMEDYFLLYRHSAEAAKEACPGIRIGGPGISSIGYEKSTWIRSFTSFCRENNLPLDFVSFHMYTDRQDYSSRDGEIVPALTTRARLQRDVEADLVRTHIHSAGKSVGHFHVSEWNLSARYVFAVRDSAFMAPYIISTALSCMNLVDSLTFWTLSDLLDEIRLQPKAFHGGMGLISAHGIPKASYLALKVLNELGDLVIGRGEGWIVTKRGRSIRILLYHLVFLDQLASQATDFSSDFNGDVYTLFEEKPAMDYTITLCDTEEKYRMCRCEINRKYGSAFDVWGRMGSVSELRREEIEYLKSASVPRLSVCDVDCEDHKLVLDAMIPPNGCQLIILEPVDQ